jgi:RNA polymerase sigma-32 factor
VVQRRILTHLHRETAKLEAELGHADRGVLARRLRTTEGVIERLEPHLRAHEASLDTLVDSEGVVRRVDLMAAAEDDRPDVRVEDAELRTRFAAALDAFETTLTPRQRTLFQERWRGDSQPSMQEVGDRMGISRERVRQIEGRLLARLRDHVRRTGLAA